MLEFNFIQSTTDFKRVENDCKLHIFQNRFTRAVVGIQSWDPLRLNVSSSSSRAPSSTAPLM